MAVDGGGEAELRRQLKEAQKALAAAQAEREDLVRDLEAMCLSDGGATFNSSSVLQERVLAAGALRVGRGLSSCRGLECDWGGRVHVASSPNAASTHHPPWLAPPAQSATWRWRARPPRRRRASGTA